MRGVAVVAGLLVLVGCTTVGPDHESPELDLPDAYDAPVPEIVAGGGSDGPWWTRFEDPLLDDIIGKGLESSLELESAASRVREARAVARRVEGETGPSLDGSVEAEAAWERDDGDRDSGDDGAEGALLGALGLDWEIDLFGGLARSREAAWAETRRQEMLRQEARRVTVAEIARTYLDLRATERRLALTRRSLELQRRTLSLVRDRVETGLAPSLDLRRAEAEVASLQADLEPLTTEMERFRNALAVLLAQPPGALDALLEDTREAVPRVESAPLVGIPADAIRRRPDVQAAELEIAVATAEIGVEMADLYPRLTLPGTIRAGPSGIGSGTITSTVVASLSTLVEIPLFDGGARRADVTAAEERAIQAGLAYRQTVLRTLEEIESALLGYRGARDRLEALREAVRNNRLAYEQSQELYRQGLVTFLDVLDSQRQLNELLQRLALAERDLAIETVNLFSALGGSGTSPVEEDSEP